jgi:hypothetical protein
MNWRKRQARICVHQNAERNSHVRVASPLVIARLDPAIHAYARRVLSFRIDHRASQQQYRADARAATAR